MNGLLFLIFLLAVGFVAAKKAGLLDRLLTARGASNTNDWPVYARRVLNPNEQKCFHRLRAAFPDHIVLAQVSLSQLLGVKKGHTGNYQSLLNRFRQLTADFVVCNKDFSVAAIFELDGVSHDNPRQQDRDSRKSDALSAAGIPLHRINGARIPDEFQLRQLETRSPAAQNV